MPANPTLPVITEMPWPSLGVSVQDAFAEQNPGTTGQAENVRTFDSFEDRGRGGSRPGLSKVIDQRLPL